MTFVEKKFSYPFSVPSAKEISVLNIGFQNNTSAYTLQEEPHLAIGRLKLVTKEQKEKGELAES